MNKIALVLFFVGVMYVLISSLATLFIQIDNTHLYIVGIAIMTVGIGLQVFYNK